MLLIVQLIFALIALLIILNALVPGWRTADVPGRPSNRWAVNFTVSALISMAIQLVVLLVVYLIVVAILSVLFGLPSPFPGR